MGCLFSFFSRHSKRSDRAEEPRQLFSWEREDQAGIKKENFILDTLKDQTIYRLPGSIKGQQFIIQNCQNCTVYVFDHTGQIQIDDCTNCRILIGPVRGSVFIRDSTNCVLATVCQQFRTRDCRDLYVYLSCTSQPIIESSHNIRFGCLTLNYEKLAEQYQTAGISPWNNNWSNIHDFTSIADGKNYSYIDQKEPVFQHIPMPSEQSCQNLKLQDEMETSVTPYTYGELYHHRLEERCLVIFFHDIKADTCARALIGILAQCKVVLVQSKSYVISEMSAEQMLGNVRTYQTLINKGPIIGLEFAGTNCVGICQEKLQGLLRSGFENIPHSVSQSASSAIVQLEKFYNFASIQMFA